MTPSGLGPAVFPHTGGFWITWSSQPLHRGKLLGKVVVVPIVCAPLGRMFPALFQADSIPAVPVFFWLREIRFLGPSRTRAKVKAPYSHLLH